MISPSGIDGEKYGELSLTSSSVISTVVVPATITLYQLARQYGELSFTSSSVILTVIVINILLFQYRDRLQKSETVDSDV